MSFQHLIAYVGFLWQLATTILVEITEFIRIIIWLQKLDYIFISA